MLISQKWLSEFVSLPEGVTAEDVAKKLTQSVVEVEGVVDQAAAFEHMVLGLIVSVRPHPNADRLKLCDVDLGKERAQIVCGGANVAEGMKVAVALVGARVRWHGEGDLIELVPTTIRGEKSDGMICAGVEIGMGKPTDGEKDIMDLSDVDFPAGTPLAVVFGMDDAVLEIEHKSMTNRPDLFGHYGLAREIGALYEVPLVAYPHKKIKAGTEKLEVSVKEPSLCARYMGVLVEGVEIKDSPEWMQKRLRACGINPINNVVDITNYVLLELGQPMHAFDADVAGSSIFVRLAKEGETLLALDGKTYPLQSNQLVIANKEHSLAIAGVMGGEMSAVHQETTRIIFESANFASTSIRKTSQTLGLRSESSARFEKAIDPEWCELAIARAVTLLQETCPKASAVSEVADAYSRKPEPVVISLEAKFVNDRLGTQIEPAVMKDLLTRLGCEVKGRAGTFEVHVPSWRATKDISMPEDLVEEIARFVGYDQIESIAPSFSIVPPVMDPVRALRRSMARVMTQGFGSTEICSYAFASADTLSKLGFHPEAHLKLANPLSEERPYLVQSLLPNVLECVRKNQRVQDAVNVFETNRVFLTQMSGEATGEGASRLPLQPTFFAAAFSQKGNMEPFWMAKQALLALMHECRVSVRLEQTEVVPPWLHASRTAMVWVKGVCIGIIAEVDPVRADVFGLDQRVAVCELDLDLLAECTREEKKYEPLPAFPSATRDLALILSERTSFAALEEKIRTLQTCVVGVDLFDLYRGKGIEEGKKSVGVRVEFRAADRTLESKEVDVWMDQIRKMLESEFGATIRT